MANQQFTHIIAVGACYIDTILTVPAYPPEDAKQRASTISRRRGGNCPNTLEVLQQLYNQHHHNTSSTQQHPPDPVLLTVLPSPSSQDTQFIYNSFSSTTPNNQPSSTHQHQAKEVRTNLSYSFHRHTPTAASSYIIQSQSTNTRTIVNHNPLSEMTLPEFQAAITSLRTHHSQSSSLSSPSPIPFCVWIHFEGRNPTTTQQIIDWLRSLDFDITISIECEKPGRPGLEDLADRADVVFYSRSWAEGKGYTGARECVVREAQRIVGVRNQGGERMWWKKKVVLCCTWENRGAAALEVGPESGFGLCGRGDDDKGFIKESDLGEGGVVERPAWVTEEGQLRIVDTVGAGDVWIAGMLFGLLSRVDWELSRRVEFANELAGRKIMREGFVGLGEQMRERMS